MHRSLLGGVDVRGPRAVRVMPMVVVGSCFCESLITLAGLFFFLIFLAMCIRIFLARSWHYVVSKARCNYHLIDMNISI
jgi:hypothetical protein